MVNREFNQPVNGAAKLGESKGIGLAWINDVSLSKGTISFQVKGKDVLQQSFVGISFHGLNDTTYEAIYFRPFNFRAKDSIRKIHAVQYISKPDFDWPYLRENFPGKYEKAVSSDLDPNDWFDVRIDISADEIKVFAGKSDKAVLVVKSLAKLKGKKVGLWAGEGSGGEWRNLKFEEKK